MEWGMVCRRKMASTDASNLGWRALCDGKPAFGSRSKKEGYLFTSTAWKCASICQHMVGLSHLSAIPEGKSRLSPFGNYDSGVLHKSPGQSFLEAPLYTSREPLDVGSAQLVLAESSARVRETEPGSRHAISEQCPLRRVEATPTNGSGNTGNLQQARGRPIRLRKQHSLPNLFFKGQGCIGHDWPNLLLYASPPIALFPQVIREQKHRVLLVALLWRNQHWLLTAAPWPIPLRQDLLSQVN